MNRREFLTGTVAGCGLVAGCGRIPWDLPGEETPTESPTTTTDTTVRTTESTTTDTTTRRSPTETTATTTTSTTATTTRSVSQGIVNGSFEEGLQGWTVGRDLPEDPNDPGNPVDSDVSVVTEAAASGQRSLAVSIDGSQDDGTVWVQQRRDLSGMESLTVDVFNPRKSFNTLTKLAVYTGPERDLAESAFDTSQSIEDHQGWRSFTYPVDHDGVGLVAVGISVVWETAVTRLLDDVTIGTAR